MIEPLESPAPTTHDGLYRWLPSTDLTHRICPLFPGMVTFDEFLSLSQTNAVLFDQLMGSSESVRAGSARAHAPSMRPSAGHEEEGSGRVGAGGDYELRLVQLREYVTELERELHQCQHDKDLLNAAMNSQLVDNEGMIIVSVQLVRWCQYHQLHQPN